MADIPARDKYNVLGMDCADCALHVEKAVQKIPGVKNVRVNAVTGIMEIGQERPVVSELQIIKAVENAGYKIARSEARTSRFKLMKKYTAAELIKFCRELYEFEVITGAEYDRKSNEIVIRHTASWQQISSILHDSGYQINLKPRPEATRKKLDKVLVRTMISGLFVVVGVIFDNLTALDLVSILCFLAGIVIGGTPIAKKGLSELRSRTPGMNLLMSAAVVGAMLIGEWSEGAVVIFLFAFAQYLELRTMDKARNSIGSLMSERPLMARIMQNGVERTVPVEKVSKGDILALKPGDKIPVDGSVLSGTSYVDQSNITGESMPSEVGPGSFVYAGTMNKNGYLEIETERIFKDSTFSKIADLIEIAQEQKAPRQNFVESFSKYYTPGVIVLAVLVAILPPIFWQEPFTDWLYRALVLLVIACPCAFVISTPVTIISGLTSAMRHGILLKGGLYLENFAKLKAIAFDKTGTLTEGNPRVQELIALNGNKPEWILTVAASIEIKSQHPLAEAIVTYARQKETGLIEVSDFLELDGRGVSAKINDKVLLAGSHRLFEEKGWCTSEIHAILKRIEDENHTAVLVGGENGLLGIITITDALRHEVKPAIRALRASGIKICAMLTGDNRQTAESISYVAGLDEVYADLLPEDKLRIISELQHKYNSVAMVGDGVNDAPALARSDIGIAMGVKGSDTVLETADIVLMKDNLIKLAELRKISRKTLVIIQQNIFLALLLKFGFLILAIPGWATLWMAVFADMGASLLVIFNGLRVLAKK